MKFYTEFCQRGKTVYVRGYDEGSSEPKIENMLVDATLYTTHDIPASPSPFKTLDGRPLSTLIFGHSGIEAKTFAKEHEPETFGNLRFDYTMINTKFGGDVKPNIPDIREAFLDIETTCEAGFPDINNPVEIVNCVTVVYRDKTFTMAVGDFNPPDGVQFKRCADERELFTVLKKLLVKINPDVISGWNVELFDIPYLIARSQLLYGGMAWANAIAPFGFMNEQEIESFGEMVTTYEFAGIVTLDYLSLYRKYGKKQPSYTLDAVAQAELGDSKKKFDCTFKEFYTNHFQDFVAYNIHDARLVQQMDKKCHYLGLVYMLAYKAKVRFRDSFMQIRMWETMIYNYLRNKYGVIAPVKLGAAMKRSKFEGAFVADPMPGLYEWVVSFDVTSLYPSLIMQYNISPEMFVNKIDLGVTKFREKKYDLESLKQDNVCLAVNGATFSNERVGFLPEMVEDLFNKRAETKGTMLEVERKMKMIEDELKARK